EAFSGEAGLMLRAYRDAQIHGVPAGISKKLTELSIAAARARLANQAERYRNLKSDLKSKIEEANQLWRDWTQRGDVRIATPDLRLDGSGARQKK
ncbi:MAG TPA: hypothetical protein VLK65_26435, partial [Vicinamibacteria bacterium]|nr:hypothetical protein [Vicinamibacteria bacterium]